MSSCSIAFLSFARLCSLVLISSYISKLNLIQFKIVWWTKILYQILTTIRPSSKNKSKYLIWTSHSRNLEVLDSFSILPLYPLLSCGTLECTCIMVSDFLHLNRIISAKLKKAEILVLPRKYVNESDKVNLLNIKWIKLIWITYLTGFNKWIWYVWVEVISTG